MEQERVLTVVVPVYNVSDYVGRCIESILNQTYRYLEVILINDGSTDGSGEICDAYAKKDKRIKVYHRENKGLVSTRKMGVSIATGEVITFVDSDDWIEPDMYQCLMEIYVRDEYPDMVSSGMLYEWKDHTRISVDGMIEGCHERKTIVDTILPELLYDQAAGRRKITASVCNKLFRALLLKEAIEIIDSDLTLGEDGTLVCCCACRANKISVVHKVWYHYVQREGSMVREYGLKSFERIYRLKKCLENVIEDPEINKKMRFQTEYYVENFLQSAIADVYQMNLKKIAYIFPYESIPKGSRVVLYGAGVVGKSFWQCLRYGEYASVVAWIDRNYAVLQEQNLEVTTIDAIYQVIYDYVVIAVSDEKAAKEIRNMLLENGVNRGKIVWKKVKLVV